MTDDDAPARPTNAFTSYLAARIDAVAHVKDETQIAVEIGYSGPRIVAMFKTGEARVPLDKIAPLAKALDCDPAFLGHLWMVQMVPNGAELFRPVMTPNEVSDTEGRSRGVQAYRPGNDRGAKADPRLDL